MECRCVEFSRKPNEKAEEPQETLWDIANAPQELEKTAKTLGKTRSRQVVGVAGGVIPSDLAELVELWPNLSVEVRNACLELARAGVAHNR